MNALDTSIETGEITVEQFIAMDLPRTCKWRLHRGTVISLTFPKYPHSLVQRNLGRLLDRCFQDSAAVHVGFPYRLGPVDAHEADVAVVSAQQHEEALKSGALLEGAPELVVEVVSRSNIGYKVDQLERDCLANGAKEFWKVEFRRPEVRVGRLINDEVKHRVYKLDESIPLELLGVSASIAVRDIYSGLV